MPVWPALVMVLRCLGEAPPDDCPVGCGPRRVETGLAPLAAVAALGGAGDRVSDRSGCQTFAHSSRSSYRRREPPARRPAGRPAPVRQRPRDRSFGLPGRRYRKGQLPDAPPTYLYIPSMVDSSLAPEGKHTATIFTPYFPTGLDADENRSWKEQYADTCVRIFDTFAPGFADSVTNRVVFSNRYFGSTFSALAGDYSHGLLHPNQLWTGRVVEGADKFATPVDGLYLCGQCTHPGPGVTGIPGWNGAEAALKHLDARVS